MNGIIYVQNRILNDPMPVDPKPVIFTTLDAAFDYIKSQGNSPSDTWTIIIQNGYTAEITKKHSGTNRGLNCNLHVESSEGATIHVKSSMIALDPRYEPLLDPDTGSTLIDIEGRGFDQMVDVSFKNITFSIDPNIKYYKFNHKIKDENGNIIGTEVRVATMYYLKFYYVKSAIFYNCRMSLQNMNLSNLDFRNCHNIIIDNCNFYNYNGQKYNGEFSGNKDVYNTEGCILQFRGEIINLRIANSTFYKYGNDEIIGVFGSTTQARSYIPGTPEAKAPVLPEYIADHSIKKNIIITDNSFHYQKPPFASPPVQPNKVGRVWCDVLIAFLGDGAGSFFDNVYFAKNTIEIKDHVKCVLKVENIASIKQTNDFKIFGNKIIHDYEYEPTESDYENYKPEELKDINYTRDFWLNTANTELSDAAPYVEFSENTIIAKENLGESKTGHIAVSLEGGSAIVKNNLFDGTESETQVEQDSHNKPTGIVGFTLKSYICNLELIGNTFKKVAFWGKIKQKAGNIPQKANILMEGNSVEGHSMILFYNPNALPTDLRMINNYFKTASNVLLYMGFPITGNLWVSDNVWDTVIPSGDTNTTARLYYKYGTPGNSDKMDTIVFISNVITGERTMTSITLPPAVISIEENNSI